MSRIMRRTVITSYSIHYTKLYDLFDATGSYTIPFVIAATCGVIAGMAGWRARILRLRAV